jgi:hypothetical protein
VSNLDKLSEQIHGLSAWIYWTGLGVGLVLIVVLAILLRQSWKAIRAGTDEQKSERTTGVIFLLALAVNADAMFRVATEKLGLPFILALGVFFIFEAMQLNSMRLAKRSYKLNGYPGTHAVVVWGVAAVSGLVTLANSHNAVEAVVRIVLPLTVAAVWHASLVADGQKKKVGKFRYSPHRVLVTLGLIEGEQDIDYDQVSRARKIRKLVALSYRVERGGRLKDRRKEKLQKIVMVTSPEIIQAAVDQLNAGRYGLANLVPVEQLEGQSQLQLEAERLVIQSEQSREQSGPVATGSRGDQLRQSRGQSTSQSGDQLQLPVGQSGQLQSTDQSEEQSGIDDTDPDAVLMIQVRQLQDDLGRAPLISEVRRVISLEPGKTAGPEKAKRIMRKMGLREE